MVNLFVLYMGLMHFDLRVSLLDRCAFPSFQLIQVLQIVMLVHDCTSSLRGALDVVS